MKEQSYVYILTNNRYTVLYTGVTNKLVKRSWQHKNKVTEGFTKKYNVNKLVWYEVHESITEAIKKEKLIKAGSRKRKIKLIEKMNPKWRDLYDEIIEV